MASGAPMAAKARTANAGPNPLRAGVMGGGSQGKTAPYAQALPPSWNGGARVGLEQRAYFSPWRMVLERPSTISAKAVRPCGPGAGHCEITMALGAYEDAPNEALLIVTTPPGPTL